jgi:cytochrome c oxidase assembly factor CtaG
VALSPPVDARADAGLPAHMVQHVALTMVAAPLLAAGVRRMPRVHPLLAWLAFAATGWLVHFTPLYEKATESLPVHVLEHALLLGTAVVFWAQVLGPERDGNKATMSHPLRLLYLVVAMPQNTFLALAVLGANGVLYSHYADLARPWGPSPLADQRQGAGLMWVAGDLLLLVSVLLVAGAWAGHEQRTTERAERAEDAAAAAGGP